MGLKRETKRLILEERRVLSYQDIDFFSFEDQVMVLGLGCKIDDERKGGGKRVLGELCWRGRGGGRALGLSLRLVVKFCGSGGRRSWGRVDHDCC